MLGCSDAGAAQKEAVHGLRRHAVRLLREIADGGVRGSGDDAARLRSGEAGEQPEQGRLARAVGADAADHIARGDDEIEVAEQHAVGVAGGEPLGDQRGAHERTRLAGRRAGRHSPRSSDSPDCRPQIGLVQVWSATFGIAETRSRRAVNVGQSRRDLGGHMDVSRLLFALGALLVVSQVLRQAAVRLGQPPVIGEIIAGIALGPSILGAAWPGAQHWLFPAAVMPELAALAAIGITLFMFDVGLNLDLGHLRNASGRLVFLGGWNVALPFAGGCVLGVVTATAYRGGHATTLSFVLFMGVAMSITAFPVLARILDETGMSSSELAAKALAIAALGDVAAWVLLAAVTATAKGDHPWHAVVVLGELLAITVGWLLVGRRVMAMRSWGLGVMMAMALILGGLTSFIGVHAIFGGFMAGVVVPRQQARLVSARMSTVVQTLLLPVFFVVTGLQTSLGLLHSGRDALVLLACLLVAIVGKLGGMSVGTRLTGSSWRESAAMGTLMNTRGLTELVVLAVGLNLGVVTPDLFAVLVLVALVTTAMTKPLLALLGYASADAPARMPRIATAPTSPDRVVINLTDEAVAAPH